MCSSNTNKSMKILFARIKYIDENHEHKNWKNQWKSCSQKIYKSMKIVSARIIKINENIVHKNWINRWRSSSQEIKILMIFTSCNLSKSTILSLFKKKTNCVLRVVFVIIFVVRVFKYFFNRRSCLELELWCLDKRSKKLLFASSSFFQTKLIDSLFVISKVEHFFRIKRV
jgi:hypothetical protein